MVASLTGYGRAEYVDEAYKFTVEIKSYNNRFLQIDVHLPYTYSWLDPYIKNFLCEKIARGRICCNVDILDYNFSAKIVLNKTFIESIIALKHELESSYNINFPLTLDGCLSLAGAMKSEYEKPDFEVLWRKLLPVLQEAVAQFISQREREGANLAKDLLIRKDKIKQLLEIIENRVPEYQKEFINKFKARIRELAAISNVDDARLAVETAIWADKSDITEEIVRIKSHLEELEKTLNCSTNTAIGRRLDFIAQELYREANTISNKIGDILILQQVLEMKCEIEKIREQVQNIE